MRMRQCPHCGAENSVLRRTCYACQASLESGVQEPAAEADQSAPSRWDAIEPLRGSVRRRVLRPAQQRLSSPAQTPPAAPRPRSYLPRIRQTLPHIRRMAVFFRELHTMLRAGFTVAAACQNLAHRAPKGLRGLAREMGEAAQAGQPISDVMARHRELLYPWHIGIMRAAQLGGFLPDAVEQIARAYETEWETRSALRLRLFFYLFILLPAILLVIPVILMLRQPIPEEGWSLPLALRAVWASFLRVSVPAALGLLGAAAAWQVLSALPRVQAIQQRLVLHVPVVGRVARAAALERYVATLGLMLRGGLPVTEAAEEAAIAAGNPELTPRLLQVVPAVRDGIPIAQAMAATRAFDAEAINLATTGELSGALPDMLARAAGYYRDESAAGRKQLITLAGLGAAIAWGGLVGAVVYFGITSYWDFLFRVGEWMGE